jgi:hypothetical protein
VSLWPKNEEINIQALSHLTHHPKIKIIARSTIRFKIASGMYFMTETDRKMVG